MRTTGTPWDFFHPPPVVMRRTLAGTLTFLLRRSADVPLQHVVRPAEEDVDLIAFIFAHQTTLVHALRAYEADRRRVTT